MSAASAATARRQRVLVALFQRGAADGLNVVVPYREKRYYELRPTIAVPVPGKDGGALDLNGAFGLHPEMKAMHALYQHGQLAVVEAVGSPDPTRSHFDAQDYMESGTPGLKSTRDGWLNRALAGEGKGSPVRAVAMGARLPRTLRGSNGAVALNSIREFAVKEQGSQGMFETLYAGSRDASLKESGRETFEAVQLLESIRKQGYAPANGAEYPNGRFGQSLLQVAQLIKADVGLQVAFADLGGWDHHTTEAVQLPRVLREFSESIGAFCADLGDRLADVTVVTMSEFGRTAAENGNRGTDHGHANVMFVAGGAVKGGRVYGRWPGLEREQLYEGRDLAVTTDFRQVLSEVIGGQLGVSGAEVFPGWRAGGRLGLLG